MRLQCKRPLLWLAAVRLQCKRPLLLLAVNSLENFYYVFTITAIEINKSWKVSFKALYLNLFHHMKGCSMMSTDWADDRQSVDRVNKDLIIATQFLHSHKCLHQITMQTRCEYTVRASLCSVTVSLFHHEFGKCPDKLSRLALCCLIDSLGEWKGIVLWSLSVR